MDSLVYPFVKYTTDMPQPWVAAYAKWFFIRIHPDYQDDEGIFMHELGHVMQWLFWFTLSICASIIFYELSQFSFFITSAISYIAVGVGFSFHQLLYRVSSKYRLYSEVMCYRIQLLYSPGKEKLYAGFIYMSYNTNTEEEEILQLLTK